MGTNENIKRACAARAMHSTRHDARKTKSRDHNDFVICLSGITLRASYIMPQATRGSHASVWMTERFIAGHFTFGGYAAHVVEVARNAGKIRIERIVCAVDIGIVVNMSGAEAPPALAAAGIMKKRREPRRLPSHHCLTTRLFLWLEDLRDAVIRALQVKLRLTIRGFRNRAADLFLERYQRAAEL